MRTLVLLLLSCVACAPEPSSAALRVYAAASLRDLLDASSAAFEAEGHGPVRVSTGGSNLLATQLLAGARADLFLPASPLEMQRLVDAGLVRAEDVRPLFSNQLVVIAPAGRPGAFDLSQLAAARRLSIAHPEAVPAGRYAKAWLESIGLWQALEPRIVPGLDARAALAAVASGAVEFGIVYASDALSSDAVEVVLRIEPSAGPEILYPGAALRDAVHAAAAAQFLDELGDAAGPWSELVLEAGFAPVPEVR